MAVSRRELESLRLGLTALLLCNYPGSKKQYRMKRKNLLDIYENSLENGYSAVDSIKNAFRDKNMTKDHTIGETDDAVKIALEHLRKGRQFK